MVKRKRSTKTAPAAEIQTTSNKEQAERLPVQLLTGRKRKLSPETSETHDPKRGGSKDVAFSVFDEIDPPSEDHTIEQATAPFIYEPLRRDVDSIRLLTLQPRQAGDSIPIVRCTLKSVAFGEKPEYEALSYTWGKATTVHTIFINDIEVPVRENLFWALRYLRKGKPRKLWIDALCIDQTSHEDKECQIRLMDYIYTRAETVLVWLGEYPTWNPPWNLTSWNGDRDGDSGQSWYASLRRWVCNNPYWSRLWIIQEIGLARRLVVHVSDRSLEWEAFIEYLYLGKQAPGHITAYPGSLLIQKLRTKRLNRNGIWNRLETLMKDFQDAECAEVMDKIYGLLGFASDCLMESIEVDYQKRRFQLYVEVVDFFNRRQHSNDLAWNAVDRSMRVVRFSQLVCKCLKSPNVPEALPYYAKPLVVEARGAFVDEIRHLGPTYTEMMSSSAANKAFKTSIHECYPHATTAVSLREAYEAYYDRLLKMTTDDTIKVCGIQLQTRYSRVFLTDEVWNAEKHIFNRAKFDLPECNKTDKPSLENPQQDVDECRMFLGNRETMGLAPAEAQVGDVVCLFWRTDVAALLRKEETSSIYRIVGRLNISTAQTQGSKVVYEDWKEPQKGSKLIVLQMCIATLNVLTR
ncbi:heterokaryon incompatibility protein-domain-containing protein [Rhexocercosporidium sp. MPI-PUGE-AT-0058]|nr:heterokaryon incompatibility protein-domain-containing protein [Rhexocercosporidium sp. MPI-PUGE-AT-0058]